jgi:hypothetical protein
MLVRVAQARMVCEPAPGAAQDRHGWPNAAPSRPVGLSLSHHKATLWPGTDTEPSSPLRHAAARSAWIPLDAKLRRECAKWLNALTRLVNVTVRADRLAAVIK